MIIILFLIKAVVTEPVVEEPRETYIEVPDTGEDVSPSTLTPPSKVPEEQKTHRGPSLVFVIDDVGNSMEQLKPFLEIPFPVTFAIMPDRKYTRECATMIAAAGKEYILHQPMEAVGGADPGKSAIYTDMTEQDVRKTLEHNFRQLPKAEGMNNHMGSAVTSNDNTMNIIMKYLSENDKFFLDSFTISNSMGKEAALSNDVGYLKRNSMFLDNENDHESIQNAINEGTKTAQKKGHAVMIGHVMTGELAEILLDLYPNFIEDGFTLQEISELFIEMNSMVGGEE